MIILDKKIPISIRGRNGGCGTSPRGWLGTASHGSPLRRWLGL